MKDVATPANQSEVRGTIKEALTKAALVNYERLSEEARIEGKFSFQIKDNISIKLGKQIEIVKTFSKSKLYMIIKKFFIFIQYFTKADRQNNQGKQNNKCK